MKSNLYNNIHTGMTKMVQGLIVDLTTPEFPLQYITLEAYAEENDLPSGDHIGYSGLTMQVEGQIVRGKCMVGVIVENDENLFRLRSHMGQVFSRLLPESPIAVYDAETGEVKGQMLVTDGTEVMPSDGKTGRPFQLVAFDWITTLRYQAYEIPGV